MEGYVEELKEICPYCEPNCSMNENCLHYDIPCAKFKAYVDSRDEFLRLEFISKFAGNEKDLLTIMMEIQKSFQKDIAIRNLENADLNNLTKQEINSNMLMQERAIQDELSEIRQHLNWKNWKNPDWSKLDDTTNLKYEVIDVFHFVMNMFIYLGMTSKDIYEMYINKNLENVLRQKYNY